MNLNKEEIFIKRGARKNWAPDMSKLPKEYPTKEMFQKDATWANVAYRVSSELSDSDREILTGLAMTYLEKRRKEIQAENEKK